MRRLCSFVLLLIVCLGSGDGVGIYLEIHSTSHRCILGLDANATRPSLLPSSAGCAPPSTLSPPEHRLASHFSPPAFGSSWASTATPSFAAPGSSTLLPSALAASSILPAIYSMLSLLPPPTLTHIDLRGRLRRQYAMSAPTSSGSPASQGDAPSLSGAAWALTPLQQLAWEFPHQCVCVRREQWTMGVEDASTWRGQGTCEWEADGWGVGVPESLIPRDRGVR
ncbi:hypothetical protein B0H10DRAFT_20631 [Mycena sp. CBHHK59/15]|nr:hypothetical protein B0H10DRAFT_20631 [Mycena sp. CBHHK59/15]